MDLYFIWFFNYLKYIKCTLNKGFDLGTIENSFWQVDTSQACRGVRSAQIRQQTLLLRPLKRRGAVYMSVTLM